MTLETVSSWAGSPEVTLVSEGGSQVKVHRLLLGLYSDQWRLTLQGLEISPLVFVLQGVDGLQLGRLVCEIYQSCTESELRKNSVVIKRSALEECDKDQSQENIQTSYLSENIYPSTESETKEDNSERKSVVTGREDESAPIAGDVGVNEDELGERNGSVISFIKSEKDVELNHITFDLSYGEDQNVTENANDIRNEVDGNEFTKEVCVADKDPEKKNNKLEITIEENISEENAVEALMEDKTKDRPKVQKERLLYDKSSTTCPECGAQYKKRSNMLTHYRSKHEGVKYPCNQCDYQAIHRSVLQRHIQSKHEGIKYPCDQCDYQATRQSHLQAHIQSKHEGVKYPCNQCDYQAIHRSTLQTHIQSIHEGRIFYCEYCEFSSTTNHEVVRHTRSVHLGIKDFKCQYCENSYADRSSLKRHTRTAHEKKKDFCDICSKYFPNLRRHKDRLHKARKCEHCGEELSNRNALTRHMIEQHPDKMELLTCKSCDYVSYHLSGFFQHRKIHHESVSYQYCDQCEYKTKSKAHLQRHVQAKHEGVKYPCDECDYRATTRGNLRLHKGAKHGDSALTCEHCGFQTKWKTNYITHMKTHE